MIVAICGPPGAGKTTVTTRLRDRLVARGWDVEVVRSDEFSRRTYERMHERVADAASEPDAWLLDGTFYRAEWRAPFRDLGARFVRIAADLETCLARNREREDAIDEQGVHVVYREFDPLAADLVVDTDELDPAAAVERVLAAMEEWANGGA